MKSKESFIIFLKGLFMGTAGIIPGISGGTIALITGIYERLLHSLSKINFKFISYFLKGDFNRANKNIRNIDFELFIPLLTGIGLALLFISNIIRFFLQNFTAVTYAFFFGLILSAGVLLYKKAGGLSVKNTLFLIMGFLFAFLFVGLAGLQIGHSLPIIFLSGIIAICAMILPGISGAFILLFLNQYEYMLFVLGNLRFLEMFTFGFGALIGILSFSRVVNYVLNRHKSLTMFFLIGLMLGALRLPYQNIAGAMDSIFPVLISAMLGFSMTFILENRFRKLVLVKKMVNLKRTKESNPTEAILADADFAESLLGTISKVKSGKVKWSEYRKEIKKRCK
ncbi:DUF368 domain-containing protein [candidate division NPL-UPA2 bacterium]|nr:DUF368 domain-containing protein [candidate division NPL-UPA2 bacterium]